MVLKSFLPEVPGLQMLKIEADPNQVTLTLRSTTARIKCPSCCRSARRIHSRYWRRVVDAPCLGRSVVNHIEVRRFRCDNRACQRQTFAERLGPAIEPYARRTSRQRLQLEAVSVALSAQAAARLSVDLRMAASASTMLRLVRRIPLPVAEPPTCIGVDDWAMRRGHRYGTLIVDLQRRRPIEVLPDREASTLALWLTEHPQVKIVTRDRSKVYAEAITIGAPQATQVADRWHLICNLGDVVEKVLRRHSRALQAAANSQTDDPESVSQRPAPAPASPVTSPAPGQVDERRRRFDEVIDLHAQGWSVARISRHMNLHRATVSRYIVTCELPRRGGTSATSTVTPYIAHIRQRWTEGCQNGRQLWREITDRGFAGSYESMRRALRHFRQGDGRRVRHGPALALPAARPRSPRQAKWLFTSDPNGLPVGSKAYLERLLRQSDELVVFYELCQRFVGLITGGDSTGLATWIGAAYAAPNIELRRFANGIESDRAAVEAAIVLPWSNGQLEGQINRLKLIKRTMYGRASFGLLRRRILLTA